MINLRVVCLLAASLVTASVAAQAPDPSSNNRGDRSAERRARFEGMLRSLDTNGNGIIEPNEVPEDRRRMYEFMASRAGLPAGQPIPISRVLEAMSQFGRPGGGPPGNSPPPPNGAAPQPNPSPANPTAASPSPPATPGVPGFGVNPTTSSVSGFGQPGTAAVGAAPGTTPATASASPAPAGTATPSTAASNGADARSRSIAEMILRRYDRNQNGVLDKDEWGQMRNDPTPADRNHDGQITVDELAVWLVERGRERQQGEGSHDHGPGNGFGPPGGPPGPGMMPGPPGPGMMSGPPSSGTTLASTSSTTSSRKSYRFLSPQERLPAGLPSWFASQDTNHDGQVSMAEYTRVWSDEKAREFAKFDLNGDGMITPQECLRSGTATAQVPSSQAASSQASTSQATSSQASSSPSPPTAGTSERPKAKSWWMTP